MKTPLLHRIREKFGIKHKDPKDVAGAAADDAPTGDEQEQCEEAALDRAADDGWPRGSE